MLFVLNSRERERDFARVQINHDFAHIVAGNLRIQTSLTASQPFTENSTEFFNENPIFERK